MKKLREILKEANVSAGIGVRGFGDVTGNPATGEDVDNAHIERVMQGAIENNQAVSSYITNNTSIFNEPDDDNHWSKTGGKSFSGLISSKGKTRLNEEGIAGGTSSGAGQIAGLGTTSSGKPTNFAEPGVSTSAQNRHQGNVLRRSPPKALPLGLEMGMFAGSPTIKVESSLYDKISTLKGLSELNKYLQESEYGMNILQYMTENNSIPIVFEDKKTGCMCYARYGK